MNGKYYNSYSGEFKTRGELRPGAKGFDYYTLWINSNYLLKVNEENTTLSISFVVSLYRIHSL